MIRFILNLFRREPQPRYDAMRIRAVMTPNQSSISQLFKD